MRVLFAHNRYLFRGGEDESREQEITMLRSRGVEIVEYVVNNRDLQVQNKLLAGIRSVWNANAYHRMVGILRENNPDIVKVDNYFPLLSPSIFAAAKSMGIPAILSVRNYRLICPSATLFRDGSVCKDCVGRKFATPAIQHRCYRGSYLQSSAIALGNAYAHFRGVWSDDVSHYIAVSDSVKQLLIRGSIPPEKISVKPNSIADTGPGEGDGGYAVYVGRLTMEKGIGTLLEAWRQVGQRLRLKIIGSGPLENLVRQAAIETEGIEFLGQRSLAEVCIHIGQANVLIFPSEWLEPFGRTIVEAYSKGTPVIGADTDPIRHMIVDGETGALFRPGDARDLANKVLALFADGETRYSMRLRARARYIANYSEESGYAQMMKIFDHVLADGPA